MSLYPCGECPHIPAGSVPTKRGLTKNVSYGKLRHSEFLPGGDYGRPNERKLTMTLDEVVVGDTVKIARLNGEGPVKRRMMDMGLVKGVDVSVRKIAPLGDPIELTVRGYELSIRKSEAATIEVTSNTFVK